MKTITIKKWASGLTAFALLVASVYSAFELCQIFIKALQAANPVVASAIIGATVTALAGIIGVLVTQSQTKRREIQEAHRPRKVAIYEEYLDIVARLLTASNPNVSRKAPTEQELVDFLAKFKTDLILWGSPEVIKAQLKFESATRVGLSPLVAADMLYRAIRKDVGLSNSGLAKHELIRMYLKDQTELDTVLTVKSKV